MKVTKWIDWIESTIPNSNNSHSTNETFSYTIVTNYCTLDNISRHTYEEMRRAVITELRENNYHFSGNEHQNANNCVPIIDDKYAFEVSCREWGSIMEEAYPDEDYSIYEEDMRYLKWSFICLPEFKNDVKLPNNEGYYDYYNFEESAQ